MKLSLSIDDTSNMGVRLRSSWTFSFVYPYAVLLGRARRKGQMRAVQLTTLARQHDRERVVNVGYPNPPRIDEKRFDRCWPLNIRKCFFPRT